MQVKMQTIWLSSYNDFGRNQGVVYDLPKDSVYKGWIVNSINRHFVDGKGWSKKVEEMDVVRKGRSLGQFS